MPISLIVSSSHHFMQHTNSSQVRHQRNLYIFNHNSQWSLSGSSRTFPLNIIFKFVAYFLRIKHSISPTPPSPSSPLIYSNFYVLNSMISDAILLKILSIIIYISFQWFVYLEYKVSFAFHLSSFYHNVCWNLSHII